MKKDKFEYEFPPVDQRHPDTKVVYTALSQELEDALNAKCKFVFEVFESVCGCETEKCDQKLVVIEAQVPDFDGIPGNTKTICKTFNLEEVQRLKVEPFADSIVRQLRDVFKDREI